MPCRIDLRESPTESRPSPPWPRWPLRRWPSCRSPPTATPRGRAAARWAAGAPGTTTPPAVGGARRRAAGGGAGGDGGGPGGPSSSSGESRRRAIAAAADIDTPQEAHRNHPAASSSSSANNGFHAGASHSHSPSRRGYGANTHGGNPEAAGFVLFERGYRPQGSSASASHGGGSGTGTTGGERERERSRGGRETPSRAGERASAALERLAERNEQRLSGGGGGGSGGGGDGERASPGGLYERGVKQRLKREAAISRRRREREAAELASCTFEPRIKSVLDKEGREQIKYVEGGTPGAGARPNEAAWRAGVAAGVGAAGTTPLCSTRPFTRLTATGGRTRAPRARPRPTEGGAAEEEVKEAAAEVNEAVAGLKEVAGEAAFQEPGTTPRCTRWRRGPSYSQAKPRRTSLRSRSKRRHTTAPAPPPSPQRLAAHRADRGGGGEGGGNGGAGGYTGGAGANHALASGGGGSGGSPHRHLADGGFGTIPIPPPVSIPDSGRSNTGTALMSTLRSALPKALDSYRERRERPKLGRTSSASGSKSPSEATSLERTSFTGLGSGHGAQHGPLPAPSPFPAELAPTTSGGGDSDGLVEAAVASAQVHSRSPW